VGGQRAVAVGVEDGERRRVAVERRLCGRGQPLDGVERVVAAAGRLPQHGGVDRPRDDAVDRQRRAAVAGGRRQPQDLAVGRQPHPQRLRAGLVQPDAAERERQHELTVAARGQRVQRRVEQRGVHAEAVAVFRSIGVERDLGVQLVAVPPHRADVLERRPVGEADVGEPVVQRGDVDGLGAGRRPRAERRRLVRRRRGRHGPAGVPDPLGRLVVVSDRRARVDRERARAVVVGLADAHLQGHRRVAGEHERGLERELLDDVAAGVASGVQRELDEGGAGQQDGVEHGVVGQPRRAAAAQAAGEDHLVLPREGEGGAEQRVAGLREPGAADVADRAAEVEPVALVLERVGRQVDEAARRQGRPVDVGAVGVQRAERAQHGLELVVAVAQGRRERALVDRRLGHRGEHGVRADLQEPRRLQRADAVGEPDRLAHLPDPVRRARHLAAGGGDDRDRRRVVLDRLRDLPELVEHRLHQRRVERVRDVDHDRRTPASSDASSASSASRSPDSTTDRGPLTAASDTPSGSATSSSAACTASIAPPAGSALISRPRLSTSRAASSSESTPAMCAPASSPTE
jgi:hypothetical protein